MTKAYTMTNGELVTYKELQIVAKDFGIKANQKADVLLDLIAKAAAPVEEVVNDQMDDEYESYLNGETLISESASEASATTTTPELDEPAASASERPLPAKVFTFIRSNNLGVVFLQKGVTVKIGWSLDDAKPYIKVGDNPKKAMMIQSAIDKFKTFNNGVHGDVARIVKALVRIRKMPAQVLAQLNERKREQLAPRAAHNPTNQRQHDSRVDRKENAPTARYSGTIDASWLAEFRNEFFRSHDRQPTGFEIRDAFINRVA